MSTKSTKSAKKNKWAHIWGNIESFNIFNVKKIFNPSEPPSLEENIPDKEKNSRYINKKLPIQSMFYGLGFIILFMGVLKIFRFICIVLILAMFSCFMLLPIIRFIVKKTKINRTFISAIISIIYTAILLSIGWIILNSLIGFFSNFGLYEKQLNTIITDIIYNLNNLTKNLDQNLLSNNFPHIKFSLSDYIIKRLSFNFYLDSANNLFTFISGVGLICLFVFFMLNEAEKTDIKLKVIFKERAYKFIYQNLEIISAKISRYLQLKTIVSGLTAFLVWLILNFFQMNNPMTWAFFAFAFNFIPSIGSIAVTALITLMSIIQFYPTWDTPIFIGLFITITQILIGNILDPKLQGNQLDLSPLLILISLTFWGYIWGVIGMFLAVPMLEILRIIFNNIDTLKPLATFISSGKRAKLVRAVTPTSPK